MKATIRQESKNEWHVELYINSYDFLNGGTYIKEEYAQKRADYLNSMLSSHVQSALSAKVDEIKAEFSDNKIRELNPIWVRDEILKRLTK